MGCDQRLGAGAVVGGLVTLRLRPRRPLVAANLAGTLLAAGPLLLARPFPAWVVAAGVAAGSAGLAFLNEVWNATMQRLIPRAIVSRLSSYDWLISIVMMPLGFAVTGPVAGAIGRGPTLVTAAAITALPLALIVLVPGVRSAGVRDVEASPPAPEPA